MINVLTRYYGLKGSNLQILEVIQGRLILLSSIRISRHFSVSKFYNKTQNSNKIFNINFISSVSDFYRTDCTTKVSRIMTSCTQMFTQTATLFW